MFHNRLPDILSCFSQDYQTKRETLIQNEQLCLRVLGYNLNVDLPYRYMLNYIKAIDGTVYSSVR
jgi:hypothetical protein